MLFNYCFLMSNMTYLIYFCLHPPSSLKQNPFPFLVSTGSERHPGSHRCGLWSIWGTWSEELHQRPITAGVLEDGRVVSDAPRAMLGG